MFIVLAACSSQALNWPAALAIVAVCAVLGVLAWVIYR